MPPSLATHPQKTTQKQSLVVYTQDWTQPNSEMSYVLSASKISTTCLREYREVDAHLTHLINMGLKRGSPRCKVRGILHSLEHVRSPATIY